MPVDFKQSIRAVVERNVRECGFHIHLIKQAVVPRYAYTIGLWRNRIPELILPGAIIYSAKEAREIVRLITHEALERKPLGSSIELPNLGTFRLDVAHPSWTDLLMHGAADYYGGSPFEALQILPDREHWTLDIPDLSSPRGPASEPVWRWLLEAWPYATPSDCIVTTNLQMLRGARATEAARWEEREWEVFAGAGPDVAPADMRVVPLATVIGIDPSLVAVTTLNIGDALWRDPNVGDWQAWR